MRKSNHKAIRELLRANPDGLTAAQVSLSVGAGVDSVTLSMRNMPDAYIDRWMRQRGRGAPMAIWCVVEVPDDCPRPSSQ